MNATRPKHARPAALDRRSVLAVAATGLTAAALVGPTGRSARAATGAAERAWSPLSIPDCDAWFDAAGAGDVTMRRASAVRGAGASTGGMRDGQAVAALANLALDSSGTDAAEDEPGQRPTFRAAAVAGKPALQFDQSRLTSSLGNSPSSATYVAVIEQDVIAAGSFIGTGADGGGTGFEFRVNADGTVTGFRSGVWQIGSSTRKIIAGRPNLVAFQFDSSGSWACMVNGEVSGFGYGGWAFHNTGPTTLALGYSVPTSAPSFKGRIAEVIRWRRPLRGSELRQVHDRLATKWGVRLSRPIGAATPSPLRRIRGLKGANISPKLDMYAAGGSVWTTFWCDWDWAWVRFCIDRARRSGAGAVRIIGDVAAVASGRITQHTYDARQRQVITYCAKRGLRYYPCGFDLHGAATVPVATIATQLATTARLFAAHRTTVIGFDLVNELATNYNTYGKEPALQLVIAVADQVRHAAPGLPLTASDVGDLNWGVLSRGSPLATYRRLAAHLDFFDVHAYAGTSLRAWHLVPYELSVGRPLVIGEFGEDVHSGGDQQGAAYYARVRSLRNASASVAAVFQWAAVEDTCGLWSETGDVPRPLTTAAWRRF